MQCVLRGASVRTLQRAVACLSKVGNNELLIEGAPGKVLSHRATDAPCPAQAMLVVSSLDHPCVRLPLVLRTLNLAKSAFAAFTFTQSFFDSFQLSVPTVACSILAKNVAAAFRTPAPSIESLTIALEDSEASKMTWTIACLNGVKKTYWVTCNQGVEMLTASVDHRLLPSYMVIKPKDFNRLLGNFQSTLPEVTLIATEPASATNGSTESYSETKAIELKSFVDPARVQSVEDNLHTQLWIDPSEELQGYKHTGAAVDVTFSVKELKAFLAFCEATDTDMYMYFDKAGNPVLFSPCPSNPEQADFEATLILATVLESQLDTSQSAEPPQEVEGSGRGDGPTSTRGMPGASAQVPGGPLQQSQTQQRGYLTVKMQAKRVIDQRPNTIKILLNGWVQQQEAPGGQSAVCHGANRKGTGSEEGLHNRPSEGGAERGQDHSLQIETRTLDFDEGQAQGSPQLPPGRNLSVWADPDPDDDEDYEDEEFVRATPPEKRGRADL
eukprot:SM000036S13264  [mRNA]  locus=s36:221862:225419:+ [translate_table: standard]